MASSCSWLVSTERFRECDVAADDDDILPLHVRIWISLAVLVAWGTSVMTTIAAFFLERSWNVSPWLHLIMLGVAASALGSNFVKGIRRE